MGERGANQVYLNDDPRLTLTNITSRSKLLPKMHLNEKHFDFLNF